MAETPPTTIDFTHQQPVPGTPGIQEMRSSDTEGFRFCTEVGGGDRSFGIRKFGLRAEIDTSPPFASVKEAVTRFEGSGSWVPLYKLGEICQGVEEFDLKKVEEQAAELEKDLIVKELETLDVLEELGTTKKIVEELKLQLQKEALKCMTNPENEQIISTSCTPAAAAIKEMNKEHQQQIVGSSSPSSSSPDLILMELKQAKLNLGKTINDLGVIQSSVESLNKKMKKEKSLLEKSRERLEHKPQLDGEQFKKLIDISRSAMLEGSNNNEQSKEFMKKTAEMRWVAAKKMEEAAKAAEALAIAEIKAFNNTSGFILPEPEDEANLSKLGILNMLNEAAAEVKNSKQALEEAVNGVEIANRKQLAAGEALRRWTLYSPIITQLNNFHPESDYHRQNRFQGFSPVNDNVLTNPSQLSGNEYQAKPPGLRRPTVSMRDVLSKKQQVQAEECVVRRQREGEKVALSQMLHELREDLTFPKKPEINCDDDHRQPKHFFAQRRKFGFIHISLPLTKQSKKKNPQ